MDLHCHENETELEAELIALAKKFNDKKQFSNDADPETKVEHTKIALVIDSLPISILQQYRLC